MSRPEVSVVVPTRDRAERLLVLLESLGEQDLDRGAFEVLVIDDASADRVGGPLERLVSWEGLDLRVIRHPDPRGPAAARNTGWRAARGDLVAFTDDDCRVGREWLRALLECNGQRADVIAQGRTIPDPRDGARMGPFTRTLRVRGPNELYMTCNIAYPRALLERVGGFDERYRRAWGEDVDLGWRAKRAGGRLAYSEEALVYHSVTNPSLYRVVRRTMTHGDAVRLVREYPEARAMLTAGCLWRRSHAPLLLALAGVVLGRRPGVAVVAAIPYLAYYVLEYRGSPAPWKAALHHLPRHLVVDLVEVGTMVAGSVRHRALVL